MINIKISTIAGSLIILAIAITLGFVLFPNIEKESQSKINQITESKNNKDGSDEKQYRELNEQELTEIKELTKDWETFRDEEYGYEFKYPQDYHIEKNKYNKDINEISIISNEKCIQDFDEKCNITMRILPPEDTRVKNLEESHNQYINRFFINKNKITYELSDGLSAIIQTKQKTYFMISLPYPKEIASIFQGVYSTFKEIE